MVEAGEYNFVEDVYSSIPPGWEEFFEQDVILSLLRRLESLIHSDKGKTVVPLPENLFNVFYSSRPEDIKVILLGQDPYHNLNADGKPAAMGLSFSCWDDAPIQPSLRTMFKEMVSYYEGMGRSLPLPENGNLVYLCNQGVFLLNAFLTTRMGEPKAHSKMWEGFSRFLIEWIYSKNKKVIFLLLGREAQKFCDTCKGASNFIKIEAGHPSPLNRGANAFLGCGVFKKVDEKLKELGEEPIRWIDTL